MALVQCPECGKEISDQAISCPNCGYTMRKEENVANAVAVPVKRAPNKRLICKRLKLNFRKLSVEERKWLKKIAEKSDLLKNPKPQRGRR